MKTHTISQNSAIELVKKLLDNYKVPVTHRSLRENLEAHLYYPSLMAISDTLNQYNIENAAFKLNQENIGQLKELPQPLLTFITKEIPELILVEQFEDNTISYYSVNEGFVKINASEFQEIWEGTVLAIFPNKESGEKNYILVKKRELIRVGGLIGAGVLSLLLIILFSFRFYEASHEVYYSILVLLKSVGIIITGLLWKHEFKATNSFVDKICNRNNTNCDKVLKSKASKFLGIISWAELGVIYFLGSILTLLISIPSVTGMVSLLAGLNLIGLGFSIFSIYYQKFIVKEWCIFCIATVLILFLEGIVFFLSESYLFGTFISNEVYMDFALGFFLPVLIFIVIQPIISQAKSTTKLSQKLKVLKTQSQSFYSLLHQEKSFQEVIPITPIMLGKPDAPNQISIISNPLCGPCANAHLLVDEYLPGFLESVSVRIIFAVGLGEDDKKHEIARQLMGIYLNQDQKFIIDALRDWFAKGNSEPAKWLKRYSTIYDHEEVTQILIKHHEWCEQNKVALTPTVIFNGFEVPKGYDITDLKYYFKDDVQSVIAGK